MKTSITLDAKLLNRIDDALLESESRSAFFLDAARQLVQKRERAKRDARDAERLQGSADALNEEAHDTLSLVGQVF